MFTVAIVQCIGVNISACWACVTKHMVPKGFKELAQIASLKVKYEHLSAMFPMNSLLC